MPSIELFKQVAAIAGGLADQLIRAAVHYLRSAAVAMLAQATSSGIDMHGI
jgi:hypothetical protein